MQEINLASLVKKAKKFNMYFRLDSNPKFSFNAWYIAMRMIEDGCNYDIDVNYNRVVFTIEEYIFQFTLSPRLIIITPKNVLHRGIEK